MSFIDDLKNLDQNNPGSWPLPIQLAASALLCIALVGAGYKFDWSKQIEELDGIVAKEQEHKTTFEAKQKKVANLLPLREQMKEMEQSFGDMVRQLPNKTEVAGLLVDISQTGLAAGLEFELFQPRAEAPSEFYAELPISIRIKGNYHQMGEFVSGLAALPRIVTTHDIKIQKGGATPGGLTMSATAKTYRAIEDDE
ncbi:MAG: type 4a pilus biogenesis protein PilO [Gammaproteobacteria bacterium]|nr:type 4a pilus biogenesis protein PilO [Gammaproteobacteria bacterium]